MSKGAKSGVAKGASNKRMKKVSRDSARGVTSGAVRRLARRAGCRRMSALVHDEVRGVVKNFVENVVRDSVAISEYAKKKTVSTQAVVMSLRKRGHMLYGY